MSADMSVGLSITPAVLRSQLGQQLAADQAQQATLEAQLSSGKAITSPAQDPSGATRAMSLSAALIRSNQYVANAQDGQGWTSIAGSALTSAVTVLQQVRQLALTAGDPSRATPTDLNALASEVESARTQLLTLANTSYQGQPVFGGATGTPAAFDAQGHYVGTGSAPTRTVASGVTVPVTITGDVVFGTGATGLLGTGTGTSSAPGVLTQIVSDLKAGKISQVLGSDLGALDVATTTVENGAAQVGSSYRQLAAMTVQGQQAATTLQTQLSGVQDVNVAATITALQSEERHYQTALWATAQTVQPSLVSFLH